MPPTNRAAYLLGSKVRPLEVRDAPYTPPGPDQIVVRNAAIALNPLEQIKQSIGNLLYGHVKYPFVMGSDVAGIVVEVGPNVTRFKPGDRVVGHSLGMEKKHNKSAMCGFQLYTVLLAKMASPVAESIPLQQAVVLPLGLSTAACGLFQKDQLGLRYPSVVSKSDEQEGSKEVVVIWGGSSSVGCNAIQLATAAGYDVITTCSPRNFDLVKSLGAVAAYSYSNSAVVDEIGQFCRGRRIAGAMSIGDGGAEACVDVLGRSAPGSNRFVSMVSYPNPPDRDAAVAARGVFMARWMASMWLRSRRAGVKTAFVWGATLEDNEVGPMLYGEFLPAALERGVLVPMPAAEVIGRDLGAVQVGLDRLSEGRVSARKLVVVLEE